MNTATMLLSYLSFLVEVHSQREFPFVSFMGETLPNHAYADLTSVGTNISDPGNTVKCHTDLQTCCSAREGPHRGDWYFPNGTRLPFSTSTATIYESRHAQKVDVLRSNNALFPSGIYHCDIATSIDASFREMVFVGLYSSGGIYCKSYV